MAPPSGSQVFVFLQISPGSVLLAGPAVAMTLAPAGATVIGQRGSVPSPLSAQHAPPAPNDASLHAYANVDKTCLEWSDTCRICQRVGNAGECSNISIACQPQPITCVRREEPPKPPTPK